jgi:hypothetical protein
MTELTPAERALAQRHADDVARYGSDRVSDPDLYSTPTRWLPASEVRKMRTDPVEHIVNGLLVPGATMLWGAPKSGKSTIALDMALGVSNGGISLSMFNCIQGDVLYVSNETPRGVFNEVVDVLDDKVDRISVILQEDDPPIGNELKYVVQDWVEAVENARLVIVDTIDSMDPLDRYENSIKTAEQERVRRWDKFAISKNLSAVLVQHDSKMKLGKDDDWTRSLTGTRGAGAGASNLIYLQANPGGSTGLLHITGRSLPSVDLDVVRFSGTRIWRATDMTEAQRKYGAVKQDILVAVRSETDGLTRAELLTKFPGVPQGTIDAHLHQLTEKGDLVQPFRGKYLVSTRLRLVTPP